MFFSVEFWGGNLRSLFGRSTMNRYPSSSGRSLTIDKFPACTFWLISINFALIGDLYSKCVPSLNST